jgi:hypothetical protein
MRDGASCIYATPHHRGRNSYVAASNPSFASTSAAQQALVAVRPQRVPEGAETHPQLEALVEVSFNSPSANIRETSSRASPEPITDLQGHYVGPASSVSFLARVRERLPYSDHTSSNFTFGDSPLPELEPTPSVMVSTEDAWRLLQKFFDFTIPIDRLLHRGTIEKELQEFLDTMGSMRDAVTAPTQRAIIWMIFAMAQEHMPVEANDRR